MTEERPAGTKAQRGGSRRVLGRVIVVCLAAAGSVLIASGRPWAHLLVGGLGSRGGPLIALSPSGRALAPVVPGLALVALAGGLALLVTARAARIVIGLLLVLVGAGIAVASVLTRLSLADAVSGEVTRAVGRTGARPAELSATGWPWVAAAGGALVLVTGLVAAIRGRSWPGMSRRYELRPAREEPARTDPIPDRAAQDPAQLWAAQDRGEDPTS